MFIKEVGTDQNYIFGRQYMIRMLRSSIPRAVSYLTATLHEHIICFVPRNRRSWKLRFESVALSDTAAAEQQRLTAGFDRKFEAQPRKRFVALKQHLRTAYEPKTLVEAYRVVSDKLIKRGRKPLLFCNTEQELQRVVAAIPFARTWGKAGVVGDLSGSRGPLVVTVHAASQGVNFQAHADVVVCRPLPGDQLEQIKGRIDRPGQPRHDLELHVLMAEATVEEAEAANIKLCGSFFRTHIAPHSRKFEALAIDAVAVGAASRRVTRSFLKLCGTTWSEAPSLVQAGGATKRGGADSKTGVTGPNVTAGVRAQKPTTMAMASCSSGKKRMADRGDIGLAGGSATASPLPPAWKKPRSTVKARKKAADLSNTMPSLETPGVLTAAEVVRAGEHLCKVDPKLHKIISRVGLGGIPTVVRNNHDQASVHSDQRSAVTNTTAFQALSRGIIFQQISVTVGNVITGRLIERCGGKEQFTPPTLLTIPDRELGGGLGPDGAKNVGLSGTKIRYIRSLATAFVSGQLDVGNMAKLSDKQLCLELCKHDGIGEWTAGVFMMHHLLRRDVLLYGDLNVRLAMRDLYDLHPAVAMRRETEVSGAEDLPDTPEVRNMMDVHADQWRPYRTVVCHLLWNYHENPEAFYVLC